MSLIICINLMWIHDVGTTLHDYMGFMRFNATILNYSISLGQSWLVPEVFMKTEDNNLELLCLVT